VQQNLRILWGGEKTKNFTDRRAWPTYVAVEEKLASSAEVAMTGLS
jgi:hypothetical protein